MKSSITHSIFFPQPPAEVWEYLTRSELMELWLMKNNFKPEKASEFQFFASPMPAHNFDGNIYCKVLEIEPTRKLVYTWQGGPGDGSLSLDSVVTWTLLPKDGGTEVLLVHSGFKAESTFMISAMDNGWITNMRKIEKLLNDKVHVTTNA